MELPQHEKLKALNGANQVVGDFIGWLSENGYAICRDRYEDRDMAQTQDYYPVYCTRDKLIADFFGIDAKALEAEKEAIIEEIRNQQGI